MPTKFALLLCLLLTASLPSSGEIRILSVTSSANFVTGKLQPGSLVSIFCTGIQDLSGVVAAEAYPLPRTLANIRVTANGTDTPLLAVAGSADGSYQQINLQVPWGVDTTSGLTFEVSQRGDSARVNGSASSPWPVFFVDASGYAIAQHAADYRPVTPGDPARPGEWVVAYATNLGPVRNQPPDGYPAVINDLAPIVPDPSPYRFYYGLAVGPQAGYGSGRIESNYFGMAPGSILYQVNLRVPDAQPAGDLVFQLVDLYYCGFFFTQGCGRGYTTAAASMPAKIPVGR